MHYFKQVLLLSAILLWAAACQPPSEQANNSKTHPRTDSCTFQLGDTLRIKLDSLTSRRNFLSNFDHAGRTYLLLVNFDDNSVYIHDWASGQLQRKIKLAVEGPKGVGNIQGVLAASPDSIFVLAPNEFRLSLVNGQGNVLRKYPMYPKGVKAEGAPMSTDEHYVGAPVCDPISPMVKLGNRLYLKADPRVMVSDHKKFFGTSRFLIELNLETGEVAYSVPYPELYRLPGRFFAPTLTIPSYTGNGLSLVFNFPADNQLYEHTPGQAEPRPHPATSSHFEKVAFSTKPLDPMSNEAMEQEANNPYFARVMYDPHRQVYYRMAYIPDTKNPFSATKRGVPFFADFSLIILNRDFQKVGEYMLPRSINSTHFLCTPQGLYGEIGENEDEMVFQQLKLVGNEK